MGMRERAAAVVAANWRLRHRLPLITAHARALGLLRVLVEVERVDPLSGEVRSDGGLVFEPADGTVVGGLAPVGVPWTGVIRKGRVVPAKGCPSGEFAVTHIIQGRVPVRVIG